MANSPAFREASLILSPAERLLPKSPHSDQAFPRPGSQASSWRVITGAFPQAGPALWLGVHGHWRPLQGPGKSSKLPGVVGKEDKGGSAFLSDEISTEGHVVDPGDGMFRPLSHLFEIHNSLTVTGDLRGGITYGISGVEKLMDEGPSRTTIAKAWGMGAKRLRFIREKTTPRQHFSLIRNRPASSEAIYEGERKSPGSGPKQPQ